MKSPDFILPDYTTPAAFAVHFGVSERKVREIAADLGAYRKLGNKTILMQDDVETILEATRPCHSKFTSAVKSGTTGELLPVGDYAALREQRTKQPPKGSRPTGKPKDGSTTLMGLRRT